jgi:hypothetical protein
VLVGPIVAARVEAQRSGSVQSRNAAFAEIIASVLKEVRSEVTKAEAASRLSVRAAWVTAGMSAAVLAGMAGFWVLAYR